MKMELIVSSEMSAIRTQMPGNYPKRNKLHLEHDKSLKTRKLLYYLADSHILYYQTYHSTLNEGTHFFIMQDLRFSQQCC